MIFPNDLRLAGCSAVAFLMMSIPGLTTQPLQIHSQPTIDPSPATIPALTPIVPKKKLSLFKRASNIGIASWYGAVLQGHKTASGETFDMNLMTACHRTLPFGTIVKVIDLTSGKSVIVRINDRGVLFRERIIDLSRGAADRLGIRKMGTANVRLEVLNKKQIAENQLAMAATKISPAADAAQAN